MTKELLSVREQIQQDILSFASDIDDEKIFFNDEVLDELCEIVVRNFEKLTWNDNPSPYKLQKFCLILMMMISHQKNNN